MAALHKEPPVYALKPYEEMMEHPSRKVMTRHIEQELKRWKQELDGLKLEFWQYKRSLEQQLEWVHEQDRPELEQLQEWELERLREREQLRDLEQSRERLREQEQLGERLRERERLWDLEQSRERLRDLEQSREWLREQERLREQLRDLEQSRERLWDLEQSRERLREQEQLREQLRDLEQSRERLREREQLREQEQLRERLQEQEWKLKQLQERIREWEREEEMKWEREEKMKWLSRQERERIQERVQEREFGWKFEQEWQKLAGQVQVQQLELEMKREEILYLQRALLQDKSHDMKVRQLGQIMMVSERKEVQLKRKLVGLKWKWTKKQDCERLSQDFNRLDLKWRRLQLESPTKLRLELEQLEQDLRKWKSDEEYLKRELKQFVLKQEWESFEVTQKQDRGIEKQEQLESRLGRLLLCDQPQDKSLQIEQKLRQWIRRRMQLQRVLEGMRLV